MDETCIHLRGTRSSVVLDASRPDMPVWRHWGRQLPVDLCFPDWDDTAPVPSFSLDSNVPLSLVPLFGDGWFSSSALLAHRAGRDGLQGALKYEVRRDGMSAEFVLIDSVAGLTLTQRLVLDPSTDVLTLSCELRNDGTEPLDVQWLASGSLPLPPAAREVISFSGRHNHEFIEDRHLLGRHAWRRENRRGLTSHDCPPMASVLGAQAGQHSGPVWSAQLAWSGNHAQSIDWLDEGRWLWMAGEWFAPGEVQLAPGGTLKTPEWLATFSSEGLDGAARNFHASLRTRGPGRASVRPRPVHLNTWEGFYFNHDEAELMALASEAATLGIERFVLDDGWFRGRADDTAGLGDWQPDLVKYPRGLKPLADHVTGLGMEFGLWVEPEMVNPDSELYRAHPDWTLQIEGRAPRTARNQLVLDLARPQVGDYLFECLGRLLSQLPISYLKWDHNRDLTQAAGQGGRAGYHRQVLGAYALIDRLRAAFPEAEIEACAGGGGRIDPGILARTDRVWTSDCIDARSRVAIQRGFLQFLPPEIMGAHVGASPAHSTGRSQSIAFRAGVACTGHFGVELDPRRISPSDRTKLQAWIAFHKHIRSKVHGGKVWRGDAGDGVVWQAHGDGDGFLLFIYRLDPTGLKHPPSLTLPFASEERIYRLVRVDPGRDEPGNTQKLSFARSGNEPLRISGAWLREVGLPLPALRAETCVVIEGTPE